MKPTFIYIGLLFIVISGCKPSTNSIGNELKIILEPKSNSTVSGFATFKEKNGKVKFEAHISGLTPGTHAIHIHEKADCSSVDAASSGGHWNPTFTKHGKWNSGECHKGDIGNFEADKDGHGMITLETDEWCIGCGDQTKDVLGKGLIVHQNADDFVTQPTGNAGGRIACSAIIR